MLCGSIRRGYLDFATELVQPYGELRSKRGGPERHQALLQADELLDLAVALHAGNVEVTVAVTPDAVRAAGKLSRSRPRLLPLAEDFASPVED